MSDELFLQIQQDMLTLDSEEALHRLVELTTSVQSSHDAIIQHIVTASKLVTPAKALFLVKFVFLLGKKDPRFFTAVHQHVPSVVLYCYQVAPDRSSLQLFVSSWLMNAQWRSTAEQALAHIRVFENQELLNSVVRRLEETDLGKRGINPETCGARLRTVIAVLNDLNSVLT